MTIGYLDSSYLDDIADAIREKTGDSASMSVGDMPDEIAAIPTGGGGDDVADLLRLLFQDGTASGTSLSLSASRTRNITGIRQYAFYNMKFPAEFVATFEYVENIGDYAFALSYLTEITFNKARINAGKNTFDGCTRLTAVKGPCAVEVRNEKVFSNCSNLISAPALSTYYSTKMGSSFFSGCSKLQSVTLPNTLTEIGGGAFSGCTLLPSITIPDSVTSIGVNAFYFCQALTSITLPEGLTSLGSNAFNACTSLTELTIPASVTSMPGYWCSNCSSLKKLICKANLTSASGNFGGNLSQLEVLDVTHIPTVNANSKYNPFMPAYDSLKAFIVRDTTPPNLTGTYMYAEYGVSAVAGTLPPNAFIYVPDEAVETYKVATNWSVFANYIKPLSEYVAS